MNDLNQMQASQKEIERESLAWVNLLSSGAVSAADAAAFSKWRDHSTAHRLAFEDAIRFQRAVRSAVKLERDAKATAYRPKSMIVRASAAQKNRRAVIGGLLAASAGYLVVRPPGHLWPSLADLASDYRTGAGGRRDFTVARGVSATLNTRSAAALKPFGFELISGEAAVVAAHAPAAVTVAAGKGAMTLASADINLRYDGETACVSCLSGEVEVRHPRGVRRLVQSQDLIYTDERLGDVIAADPTVDAAWRRGLLIFRNAPLQRVVDELNRYRPGKIVLLDPKLTHRPVYAVFRIDDLDGAVAQVQDLTGAKVAHLPAGVVVLS